MPGKKKNTRSPRGKSQDQPAQPPPEQHPGDTPVAPWDMPAPQQKAEAEPVREAVQKAVRAVDSPEKAEEVVDRIEAETQGQTADEVARERQAAGGQPPDISEAARAVREAAETAPAERQADQVLIEAAREVVAAEGQEREALAEAVQEVLSPEQQGAAPGRYARQREFLTQAILRRMRRLDALDARLFLLINHLPHTRVLNGFFYFITFIFNAGMAWYTLMGLAMLLDRKHGLRVTRTSAVPLAIATSTVEYPIKSFFRRRRPFITVIKTIVIGKKPGSWSFPSGHSAAAFGGAWLLGRHYPRMRALLYGLAGLVGFSRIYLGDHYPGDVVTGSATGIILAEGARRLLRALGLMRPRGAEIIEK